MERPAAAIDAIAQRIGDASRCADHASFPARNAIVRASSASHSDTASKPISVFVIESKTR
jgi:hypothetical protein